MKKQNSRTYPDKADERFSHLPPPFYTANDEAPQHMYPSEASPFGKGYRGLDQYGVKPHEPSSRLIGSASEGVADPYRKLGDRRWQQDSRGSWKADALRPGGYRSMSDRMEGAHGHQGKGPKSYRRSDERILDDVNGRLCEDPWLDASQMETSVKDGEVSLTGTVRDRASKRRAEDIAEGVRGVTHIENRLRIAQAGEQENHGSV